MGQFSILYFGARCEADCCNTKRSFNLEFITAEIRKLIVRLHFCDNELAEFDARTQTSNSLLAEKKDKQAEQVKRQKKHLRASLTYLRTEQLGLLKSGAYTPETLVEERERLETELNKLSVTGQLSEADLCETAKEVVDFSELLKSLVSIYDYANPSEKEQIVKKLFSELFLLENTLSFIGRMGLEVFFNRPYAFCEENSRPSEQSIADRVGRLNHACKIDDWLLELQPLRPQMKALIDSLNAMTISKTSTAIN